MKIKELFDYIRKNKSKYDLIILDIMLPKVNGIEILKEIKILKG